MTVHPSLLLIPSLVLLCSCDQLPKPKKASSGKPGSIAEEVQITSAAKPEIVAAFEAISLATREHNRVLLENINGNGPVNGPAYSAGMAHLDRSARQKGGVAKQIIDAIATTWVYEKTLFVPFDTIRGQMAGMETWTKDQALQRRGYVQIIDQQLASYDEAVVYLERGEIPLLRQNFDKHRVPREVTEEFLRLRGIHGKEVSESELGMFREQRLALQSYRAAMTSANAAQANAHVSEGDKHQQQSKQFEAKMVAAIRQQLDSAGPL
jgi:hypothetical protein